MSRLVSPKGWWVIAVVASACSGGSISGDHPTSGGSGGSSLAGIGGSGGVPGTGGTGGVPDTGGTGGVPTGGLGGVPGTGGAGGVHGTGGAGCGSGTGGGSGGLNGMSGVTGSGGIVTQPCNEVDFCPSQCGNGVRDTCPPPPCAVCSEPSNPFTEPCDGADLGGATCASLGWGSGTLSCTSTCGFDLTACTDCVVDTRIPICDATPIVADILSFTLSAKPSEIGLAWVGWNNGDSEYLTRLSPTFAVLSQTEILPRDLGGAGFAIAPLGSGWVTARTFASQVEVQPFDANGVSLGALTIATSYQPGLAALPPPSLVAGPNGGALVCWPDNGALSVALIAADGTSVSAPEMLPSPAVAGPGNANVTATFADGGFYVLSSFEDLPTGGLNSLVRIEIDGTVGSAANILPGIGYGNTMLVTGASDLRVVYPSDMCEIEGLLLCPSISVFNGVVWQQLTSTGAAAAPPVTLTTDLLYYPTAIGFGNDTMLVFSDHTISPGSISLMHVGPDGALAEPTLILSKTPSVLPRGSFAIASTGSEIVATIDGALFTQIVSGTGP